MRTPTDKQIRALHEKHAPERTALERVFSHCEIVCEIAEQLLARRGLGLDADGVRAGSLLHDIGVYRLYDAAGARTGAHYIRHGVLGHELLSEEGFPPVLCRFCSCHTGMGLSRADVRGRRLPIPVADYLAESGEERLVMYADKFHSKTTPPTFVAAASYAAGVRRFGADKVATFAAMREEFGEPDLRALAGRYGQGVV